MSLNINGRMKVKTLKEQFKADFGLSLRLYDGRSFANEDSTLASIRKEGDINIAGEFSPRRNMLVGNFEEKMMETFGIKCQISGSDDSYLCDNDLTLAGALEKDIIKTDKKLIKTTDRVKASKMKKNVNRITHISWKLNISTEDFESVDWNASDYSLKAKNSISIYELIDEEGDVEVQFWTYERDGERFVFKDGDSLFSNIESDESFAGDTYISRNILCMGWPCWQDELEYQPHEQLLEVTGADYGGEFDLSDYKDELSEFEGQNYITFSSVFNGEEVISLSEIEETRLFTPETFEPDDDLESCKIIYQSDEI